MALFGFGRPRAEDPVRHRIEAWARTHGGFAAGTVLRANEIACADPACPGYETILLVMEPGRPTRACRITKPAEAVTEEDVGAVLSTPDLA